MRWLGAAPGLLVLVLFFLVPLVAVTAEAFVGGGAAFAKVFGDPLFWRGLAGSTALAFGAGLISLAFGVPVALRMARMSAARRTLLIFCISLPLTFSGLIIAYGFILVFGRAGVLTMLLAYAGVDPAQFGRFIYSTPGLAFAYSYYLIPRFVMIVLPVLLNFDQRQLLAAESLGATRWQRFRDILVPAVLPAVAGAFFLVVAVAYGTYGTALALVGTQLNILPLLLYSKIADVGSDFPAAAALSLVILGLCSVVMSIAELFVRGTHESSALARRAR
jgi:putative spermidine/putrescine transport system permease protein